MTRRGLVFALALNYSAMMVLAIAVNLLPVFLTTLRDAFDAAHPLTNEQLGRIAGMTFFGVVAGILISGPLADRWGMKPFAIVGNLLIALGLGMLGLAETYNQLLVACFVMGFGGGTLDLILSPIVCAFQPEQKTAALNWLHSFYCVGAVLTILLATLALRWGVSWRGTALAMVCLPLGVGMGFIWLKIPSLLKQGEQRMRLRELFCVGYFWWALLAIFLGGATELGMAQWLPDYAQTRLGYSQATGGMALLAFSLAMAVGRWAVGYWGHKTSPIAIMLACSVVSVGLFVAGSFMPVPGIALGACIAAGLTGACLWPSVFGITTDRFPRGGASMFGVLSGLGNLGGMIMPWIVGAVADQSNLSWGLVSSAAAPALMIPVLLRLRRYHRVSVPESPVLV